MGGFTVINDGKIWQHKNRRFREVMTFDESLEWHLTKVCFPDKPVCMIPACKVAIELVNSGKGETLVKLPDHIFWMSYKTFTHIDSAPAIEIVNWCELEKFLNKEGKNE